MVHKIYRAKDLTYGRDARGDMAIFIERKHLLSGEEVDKETKGMINRLFGSKHPAFFRIIENGIQTGSHGWIQNGKIFQWG
jgi:hypothetical protein